MKFTKLKTGNRQTRQDKKAEVAVILARRIYKKTWGLKPNMVYYLYTMYPWFGGQRWNQRLLLTGYKDLIVIRKAMRTTPTAALEPFCISY